MKSKGFDIMHVTIWFKCDELRNILVFNIFFRKADVYVIF